MNEFPYLLPAVIIISFILGFIFGRFLKNNKHKQELKNTNTTTNTSEDEVINISEDNKIKAIQTRGRSGIALNNELNVSKSKKKPTTLKLDFSHIGVASEAAKDDLKQIEGIGPFIEKKLNSIGIYKYEQLSKLTDKDIEIVTKLIEFFPGRIERDDWKGKALRLHEAKKK